MRPSRHGIGKKTGQANHRKQDPSPPPKASQRRDQTLGTSCRDHLFNEDLYGQHVDATGVSTWNTHGALLCTLAEDGSVEMCADGTGGAALVWRAEDDQHLHAGNCN